MSWLGAASRVVRTMGNIAFRWQHCPAEMTLTLRYKNQLSTLETNERHNDQTNSAATTYHAYHCALQRDTRRARYRRGGNRPRTSTSRIRRHRLSLGSTNRRDDRGRASGDRRRRTLPRTERQLDRRLLRWRLGPTRQAARHTHTGTADRITYAADRVATALPRGTNIRASRFCRESMSLF